MKVSSAKNLGTNVYAWYNGQSNNDVVHIKMVWECVGIHQWNKNMKRYANLTIPCPYTVHQFTNWCFLVLYVYCILCESLCQLKYNGNTTNFPSAFAEPASMCLCCFVLISMYLAELQYLKYIMIPKCR